jgi:protein-disulfide isomerase
MSMTKPILKSSLDVLTSFVLIAAALTLVYKNVTSGPTKAAAELQVPSEALSLDGAQIRGANDAEAVMIVYADFQCPFCARFANEIFPDIQRRYVADGRVAVAFRHLPLPIHPQAAKAAVVAECAAQQGRFWEMHDRLFGETKVDLEGLPAEEMAMGLDVERMDACLLDKSVLEAVAASANQARGLGIRGTPAFFFGRRLADGRVVVHGTLSGARPLADFERELDAVLTVRESFWQRWARRIYS